MSSGCPCPRRHRVPVPQRLGGALAEAGPSITLAAAAETLAFALGGLTSMPAVRNFALCAALAIFLDFLLQVCGLLPMRLAGATACCPNMSRAADGRR
jgi:Sterol-sensing domain of SREBP cleavage-activation